jgi:hypothetical protein
MKKTLIIIGTLVILLAIGFWIYALMYGTPQTVSDIFARFGSGDEDPVFVPPEDEGPIDVGSGGEGIEKDALRQLTTNAVAGAAFLENAIRYVERGTGHVYEINLQSGEERLISGTTIPRTMRAVFSSAGDRLAVIAESEGVLVTRVGSLVESGDGDGSLLGVSLPIGARDIGFSDDGSEVFYREETANGSVGRAYNFETLLSRTVFETLLRDVRVLWGSPLYLFTTPTAAQTGYLYRVEGDTLSYVTSGGKSLMAFRYKGGVGVTKESEEGLVSTSLRTGEVRPEPIPVVSLITEKCAAVQNATGTLACASPLSFDTRYTYPDDWYKGIVSFSDVLFWIDTEEGSVKVLSALEEASGRLIDVESIGTDPSGTLIYFVNKIDQTLWMFDTTR